MSYRPNPDDQGWVVCRDRLSSQLSLWGVTTYELECPAKPRYTAAFERPSDRAVTIHLSDGPNAGRIITIDRFERPVDNLWALAKGVESIRLNELRGLADVARQVYTALPAPAARRDPFEVLGVRSDAPAEVIEASYKALARRMHPDVGGTVQQMAELNEAYAAVKK